MHTTDFYEAIASTSTDMIALLDTQYTYLASNKTYAEVVGRSTSQLIGMNAETIFGKDFFARVIRAHADVCMRENRTVTFEDWFNFPTVGRRFMEINYYPYLRESTVVGFIVNARNITKNKWLIEDLIKKQEELEEINKKLAQSVSDLVAAKEVLLRSNESLEKFASVASHDLKSPLMAIRWNIQMFTKRTEGAYPSKDGRLLTNALTAVGKMNALIRDLLAYSKIEHQDNFPLTEVHISNVMQEVLSNLGPEITKTHAQVAYKELPTVTGYAPLLVQLFQNLISNSMKFLPKSKRPIIRVSHEEQTDGYLLFKITDNGIGISKSDIDKLFTPFTRLHSEKDYEGNGLGLVICKRIIEHHRSKIWIQSKKNTGTTILFTLPSKLEDSAVAVS
mgnify:CR=1 FL=1